MLVWNISNSWERKQARKYSRVCGFMLL